MPKGKKSETKAPPPRNKPVNPIPPPNWPPLRPLLPPTDLTLTPLVTDQIYLIRNFFPASLCKSYVSFLSSLPLTTTPGKPKKDEAVRVNDRFQVEDSRFAEMVWSGTALKELVTTRFDEDEDGYDEYNDGNENANQKPDTDSDKEQKCKEIWGGDPLGLDANIRIYRYSAGQFFAQHCMNLTSFSRLLSDVNNLNLHIL